MSRFSHRTRRGVTFIELIGVLVVAIIIIAGALALYSEANTSSRTNQLLVAIGALTGSVRALHANTANYGGEFDGSDGSINSVQSLVPVLVNANAVPPGLLITKVTTVITPAVAAQPASGSNPGTAAVAAVTETNVVINHAFGGEVAVFGFGQLFAVTANSLDQDICIRVATESTAKASSGLRGVYVGNKTQDVQDASELVTKQSELGKAGKVSGGEGIFVSSTLTDVRAALPISPTDADRACNNASDNNIIWVFQ